MATIRAFRGLRFSVDAGDLALLTAPPYDVISPEMREELAAQAASNIVSLTLPKDEPGARSKFVKYATSAATLEEWRRSEIIKRDEEPSLYRYSQEFALPDGRVVTRTKLLTLIKVEPYSKGVVLPHERTFPKHKEDRLRVLEATRTHLESIFGLIEDDEALVHQTLTTAPAEFIGEFSDPDGTKQKFERISDPSAIKTLTEMLADKRVWIADGHHRYETALAFREQQGVKEGLIPEDFMMIGLCSISDPGLALLPTHRILRRLPCSAGELRAKLGDLFEVSESPNPALIQAIAQVELDGGRAFGIALPGGSGLIAQAKDLGRLIEIQNIDGSDRLKGLDVSILHNVIFEQILGLTGLDFFSYTRIEKEALDAVEGGSPAAFLMNPPTVEDMRVIAEGGEVMPQKSTYYFPKLLSGLVMWSLKDF